MCNVELVKLTRDYTPTPILFYDLISCDNPCDVIHTHTDLIYPIWAFEGQYVALVAGTGCTQNLTANTITCPKYKVIRTEYNESYTYTIPYFQTFDTTPINALPSCFTISNDNADAVTWSVQNSFAASTPNAYHLATNTALDTNDWFFTAGLNLTAGVTYRLKFKYNTLSAGSFAENLRIRLGTGPSEASMNNTILDLSNIINTVYQTATVDFTPVTNNIFYLGFQGYSFANQSKIMIDDISVIVSPTCFEPTDCTALKV
jgi:hypothetical protein